MPRITVSMTDELYQALLKYQQDNGLQSISEALVELAAKQVGIETPRRKWGGDRKSKNESGKNL